MTSTRNIPDPDSDRPRHFKRAIKSRHKKWGIEQWSHWFKEWFSQWYGTEKARDRALKDKRRHTRNSYKNTEHEPVYRKINR